MAGCDTPRFEPVDKLGLQENSSVMGTGDKLRVGDQLMITYSGTVSDKILPDHVETIKEDGTITPPLLSPVIAAGKTLGGLQSELQTNYDKLFNHLTVTVVPQGRFYYVSGEVRKPGPEPYLGETDIIKAIAAAGDFTDFAKKTNVKITRADGRIEYVNVQKIFDEPQSFDVPIYPGDKIFVKRRIF
jgi:polysaccharide export outer membrane protein